MPGDLISVDEARARVLAAVRPLAAERVRAGAALGRVLAGDVVSGFAIPPFDSSAMDGFALIAGPPAELPVVGESKAGRPYDGELQRGQAVRISTGAVIPAGADAVVPIERVDDGGGSVRVPDVAPGANVRRAGGDVRAGALVIPAGAGPGGALVIPAGSVLGAAELGMLAVLGRVEALCSRRPRLAIAATGDELRPAG